MLYSLAIVLALAMVLCMIPVSFAASYNVTGGDEYSLGVVALDKDGNWPGSFSEAAGWAIEDKANTITYKYNYEILPDVTTGKFTEDRKIAVVRVGNLQGDFTEIDEITIDGKKLEVNELADYVDNIEDNYKWALGTSANNPDAVQAIFFPVELNKTGYTDTYLIEISGTAKNAQGKDVDATETIKVTVKLENTASYKNAKTAYITSISSNSPLYMDAYIVGDRIYFDFYGDLPDNYTDWVDHTVDIAFADNNHDAFDVVTWAYDVADSDNTGKYMRPAADGATQDKEGRWGAKLDDSAMEYKIWGTINDKTISFELETASALYETKDYKVVVRDNIEPADPKGIYFAETEKTIAIGEKYTPVVYGIVAEGLNEHATKVDADIIIPDDTSRQVIDLDDKSIIGTQEGIAYITAKYQAAYNQETYTSSSMRIIVTDKKVEEDTDKDGKTYMVTASSLRVRSGAGTNFSQIGSLKNGATVKVESIANGWAKLENGGYVSAQYLAEVVDNGEAQTMYVTARTLNVRKGPGTSYAKVGTLSRGTAVQVVGFSGNWAKLSNGYYVSTSYLAK